MQFVPIGVPLTRVMLRDMLRGGDYAGLWNRKLAVMDGHHIFLHELAILMLWLCAPALIVAVFAQLWWFRRMKVLRKGQVVRAAIGLAGTVLLAPIVSVAIWKITPYALLPRRVVPEGRVPIPPVFLPAIASCAVLASLFSWWVVRGDRHDV